MAAALYPDCFGTDHERARAVVDIDEKTIGPFLRIEQRAHRSPERLVVTRHYKHGDCFTIVPGSSDNQMAQQPRKRRPRRADSGPGQAIAKRKSDPVAPRTVHRALLDWNNTIGPALVMPHDQPASSGSRTEDKCDFLAEAPRNSGPCVRWNEQRRRDGPACFTQCPR